MCVRACTCVCVYASMHPNVRKQMNVVERNEDGVNRQCSRKKTQKEKNMVSNILHTYKLN